jgi:hypothetical protein
MRTPLLAALACFALPAPHGSTSVEACGFSPPQVLLVSNHRLGIADGGPRTRSFALLGQPVPSGVVWWQLAPGTYDGTQIAEAPALDAPVTLTLLGSAPTRVITTRRRALLAPAWQFTTPSVVLELDGATAKVALVGARPDARWTDLDAVRPSAVDTAWASAQGGRADDQLVVSHVHGTDIDTIATSAPGSVESTTLVRQGDRLVARVAGRPIGAMTSRGLRYVLVEHAGVVTSVWI